MIFSIDNARIEVLITKKKKEPLSDEELLAIIQGLIFEFQKLESDLKIQIASKKKL